MIELPTFVVAILGFFATIGFIRVLGLLSHPVKGGLRMDLSEVNSKRHMLAAGLTSQAHRNGDPEF